MQTSERTVRVGFIGAGWTERVQIPTFQLGGLTAQAICAGHVENAQRVAQRWGIPEVYASWQELITAETVDVVSIVTPPYLHREMAVAALQAGKHVICEKPAALNVAEAEAMLAAAQAAPDQMAILDHELRFHPLRAQLRRLVRNGYVGNVLTVNMDWRYPYRLDPATPFSWHHDATRGGGMLAALGSHLLDLARWIFGRIEAISARLQIGHYYRTDPATNTPQQVTADDHAELWLRFHSGAQGTLVVTGLDPEHRGMALEVVGTDGALRLDRSDRLWGKRGAAFPNGEWEPIEPEEPLVDRAQLPIDTPFAVGSYYLARAVAGALSTGVTTLPDAASFYDGLAVQRALDAARRSHGEMRWVQL
ncbi:Gfo/Idh/MocA family oxidoreductase [Litorilinea aerophila]|uniref:Gfo/Idh/MocA family oxidoreductase n=1 Tax=Litorilinea aerophila TaxID=1204385 RepID=A0A540VFY2_9CHLR|nr:Gfo/Idh/MocA family oxidoreductase [Litorilinea aerophila]MCC9076678.1 Gfo/Idh/MocA family oxidoreductase [Litorilinea aerophila]GIV77716.1 MAG: oxidoreductase [Litorilinea sp.]